MRRKVVPPVTKPLTGMNHGRLPPLYADAEMEPQKHKANGMAMSVEQMADELAIGRNVAYQIIRQPGFPSFMIGRRVLISRKGLQSWIDEQCKRGSYIPDYEDLEIPEPIEK